MTDLEAPQTRATSILERVRANASVLSPAERRVADAVLADPFAVIHLSVTELAQQAESSAASVVRMCTSLGLRGFQELKILLAGEAASAERPSLGAIGPEDGAQELVHKVLGATRQALERTADALSPALIDDVATRMLAAPRVQFGAVGTSAPLAADISYRLATIGINATFLADVHAQHVSARMLGSADVFFAISHTGSTFETLAAARAAKAAGATVIAVTSFVSSPLTEITDLAIVAGSAETAYRVEAMASRIVHLTVLDVIYSLLSLRSPFATEAQALAADVLVEHRL
ncbi:MurR/RpiR family transcriptional regulator [Okibacterium endophyticum]